MSHAVGIVGTGPGPETRTAEGYAMAYQHAPAYRDLEDCDLVACADIVPEHAEAFADAFDLPGDGVYGSHGAMLEEAAPDIVSVCVPPSAHAEVVVDCARHPAVGAIHCEKPMADTWGRSRLMAQEADRHDTQLTFNHQRRFGAPFRTAKERLEEGAIGDLERVEFAAPNLYDYGTHSLDLSSYFNDETPPAWVLCGLDYREENLAFGAHNENQAVAQFAYENGVSGLAVTGERGDDLVGCHNRLVGTDGVIEIGREDAPVLRIRRDGDWEAIDCGEEGLHGPGYIERAIADVVDAFDAGRDSELRARNALNATELSFGAYESVRRRGRVEFPLEVEDNPLAAMVETGTLTPDST
ncbi:MAG: Gfo/Idh/MocA family protein [Halobacteriales archaeon]